MKDLNAERLTLNFSRLRCWDTHRKMFQIVEKWFILSWSHLIVNSHIHFSTIWNVSDCRKMVYIEIYIFLQPETFQIVEKWFVLRWSHLIVKGHNHFSTFQIVEKWLILSWSHLKVNGHIHFSTIWNTSIFLQSETHPFFYNLKSENIS